MKYFSTFSGIGGFELGLKQSYESLCDAHRSEDGGIKKNTEGNKRERLQPTEGENACTEERPTCQRSTNQSYERPLCVGYSEIDKYAIQVYQKHFPNHTNYGDITKINPKDLPDFELFVGGFPCQAFSIAGKRMGFNDTRGTMFFEIARIVREKQPRLLLLENVKGLLSHDQGRTFYTIITTLDELGYDCQWQVLNSKNHGVPQNRERVFIIGHLRGTPRPQVFPFGENDTENTGVQRHVANTLTARYEGAQATGTYIGEGKFDAQEIKQLNQPKHSGVKIRRLTPLEAERLQGFPDNWTDILSDTQRYKTLGNAVTVNVIRDICASLLST